MTYTEQFCDDHAVLNSTTPGRQQEQRKVLLEFEDWMRPRRVEEATGADLQQWMTLLISNGLHVNTVRKYRYMVQPFFRWLMGQGVIERLAWLDFKDVSNPRGSSGRGRPRPYSRRELMRFWQELDALYPMTTQDRLRRWRQGRMRWFKVEPHFMRVQVDAVVALALYGGLRSQEIWLAGIDDIHPDNEFIVVRHGKRSDEDAAYDGSEREVPFTDSTRRLVARWLEHRAILAPDHDFTWLTLGRFQRHMRNAMLQQRFKALMGDVGDWHLHRFRHTCGTEWLRAGMPLEQVQQLLGHARLDQTLAYADLVPDDIARSIARFQSRFERAIGRPEEDDADDEQAAR